MPTKSSTGRGAIGAPSAGTTPRTPPLGGPAAAADPVAEALALDRRLAAINTLEDRLIEITRSIPGPGHLFDQPRHRGPGRTQRHRGERRQDRRIHPRYRPPLPRNTRNARSQREPLRPQHPRHVPRRARGRGASRPRRHLWLSPRRREPQGVLRNPQGPSAEARAGRRQGLGHGSAPRAVGWTLARAVRRVGRGERARQAEPDC